MITSVKIGAYPYTVEQVPDLKDQDGNDLFGEHDALGQRLVQRIGMTPDRQMTNLWHEIFHAILDQTGIHYLANNPDLIEGVIIALASGVHQVLRDNPELVAKYAPREPSLSEDILTKIGKSIRQEAERRTLYGDTWAPRPDWPRGYIR